MSEQSVVLEGVVGSDAQGFSVHRHPVRAGQSLLGLHRFTGRRQPDLAGN